MGAYLPDELSGNGFKECMNIYCAAGGDLLHWKGCFGRRPLSAMKNAVYILSVIGDE